MATTACPECGALLRGTLTGGLCPRCVLRTSLTDEPELIVELEGAPALKQPTRFGDYDLLRELGRGGMGVVYEARQRSLNRVVALKMLLPVRLASPAELERFRLEAEAVAALDHPNILPLYEIGSVQGQPFFTMKLAEGGSLASRIASSQSRSSNREAAQLVAHIARAVHYAHQRGIQHRDLKPGNILLDADGRPYVSDFGLAKFVARDSSLTLTTTILGSPAYMSPEAAAGDAKRVTTAADIYSLGAILYELLAGRPPFIADNVPALLRKIVEEEAPVEPLQRPGVPAAPVATPRLSSASTLHDLEVICLKCLGKEPQQRYASAEALAEELERWLAGEPILARPAGALERFIRWCRRRPALAFSLAALAFALAAGMAGITLQWRRAEEHSRRWQLERYAADLQVASQALDGHDIGLVRRMVAMQVPAPGEPDLRGFEWRLLKGLCAGQHRLTLTGHTATVTCVALSPDGLLAASGGMDGVIRLWRTTSGEAVTNFIGHHQVVWSVAFSADGERIVSAGNDDKVRFWTRDGRAAGEPLDGQNAALSENGARLAVSASPPFKYFQPARGVSVRDWRTGQRLFHTNLAVRRVALSREGRWLAAAGADRDIFLWDIESGAARRLPTADTVWALAFSPDGGQLAAAGFANGALLWDLRTTNPPVALPGHQLKIWGLAFSPDGRRLATTGSDRTLQLHTPGNASEVHRPVVFTGHEDEVWNVAWSRDGQQLATAGKDMTVRLWAAQPPRAAAVEVANDANRAPMFSQDGRWLLTSDRQGARSPRVTLHAAGTGAVQTEFRDRRIAGFASDGTDVIVLNEETGRLERWSARAAKIISTVPLQGAGPMRQLHNFAFAPDGTALAVIHQREWSVWRLSDGARLAGPQPVPNGTPLALALAPQARYLALTVTAPYVIWLHDLRAGSVRELAKHTEEVKGLAFSPTGRSLASASVDGFVRLWDTGNGQPLAEFVRHVEEASDVAFSPDGRTLASVGAQQSVKLWHVATAREVLSLPLPDAGHRLAFSPAGDALAFTTMSNTVRILRPPVDQR